MKLKILKTEQKWMSPDGTKKLFRVIDTDGNEYQTWSEKIGNTVKDTELDVESYEKVNDKTGKTETFLRSGQAERGSRGFGRISNPDDRASIERQVALKAAIEWGGITMQYGSPIAPLTSKDIVQIAHFFDGFLKGVTPATQPTIKPSADVQVHPADEVQHHPEEKPWDKWTDKSEEEIILTELGF